MAPKKPLFVATHPRACSTAFERVFMTCVDQLKCLHEPYGDAFYFGPERQSKRYQNDEDAREQSGFASTTYKDVLDQMDAAGKEGLRLFIKDMAQYLFPVDDEPARLAPSLNPSGAAEPDNPTVIPLDVLKKFDYAFLIRHPRRSIPSYYRCTVPPLVEKTGFDLFMPSEAGYSELRRLIDFLLAKGVITRDNLVILDADDMLDNPEGAIRAFCERTGLDFSPAMLKWSPEDNERAIQAFAKWPGFHEDALSTSALMPRSHKSNQQKTATVESDDRDWKEKFGDKAQKVIRACVDENTDDYQYLKQFSLKL